MSEPNMPVPSISQYQWEQMVKNLAKPGEAIIGTLTPEKMDLLHAAVGISGEAGELLDIVKKIVVYNKPFTEETRTHIIEEMGDLEFYMEQLRNNILILVTRMQCMAANHHKLANKQNGRYASGKYSDQQAQERLDKSGGQGNG